MLQTTCIGHLGANAEFKNVNGKEFVVFRMADTNRWIDDAGVSHEETTWVDCIMNGKPKVFDYLQKGQLVFVAGNTSLRVYSSPKDKCMKAGLTINVRQVELLGSRSDDIPSKLYSEDGSKEIEVKKYYHAAAVVNEAPNAPASILVGRNGERYIATPEGWVSKEQVQTNSEQ